MCPQGLPGGSLDRGTLSLKPFGTNVDRLDTPFPPGPRWARPKSHSEKLLGINISSLWSCLCFYANGLARWARAGSLIHHQTSLLPALRTASPQPGLASGLASPSVCTAGHSRVPSPEGRRGSQVTGRGPHRWKDLSVRGETASWSPQCQAGRHSC